MKKTIMSDIRLPTDIILKILNDRKIMKRNDRYKNNFKNCINELNDFRLKMFRDDEDYFVELLLRLIHIRLDFYKIGEYGNYFHRN